MPVEHRQWGPTCVKTPAGAKLSRQNFVTCRCLAGFSVRKRPEVRWIGYRIIPSVRRKAATRCFPPPSHGAGPVLRVPDRAPWRTSFTLQIEYHVTRGGNGLFEDGLIRLAVACRDEDRRRFRRALA